MVILLSIRRSRKSSIENIRVRVASAGRPRGPGRPGLNPVEDGRPLVAVGPLGRVDVDQPYDHAARRRPDAPPREGGDLRGREVEPPAVVEALRPRGRPLEQPVGWYANGCDPGRPWALLPVVVLWGREGPSADDARGAVGVAVRGIVVSYFRRISSEVEVSVENVGDLAAARDDRVDPDCEHPLGHDLAVHSRGGRCPAVLTPFRRERRVCPRREHWDGP